jgi:thiol-disulfide isomerase/thioredoxin
MPNQHPLRARRSPRTRLVVLLAAALFCAACDGGSPPQPTASTQPDEIEVESIDAPALFTHMRSQAKRGTIVNVWASWCGSCRGEVPMLLKLQKAFATEGLDFLFVSADEKRDFPKAIELMLSWSAPLPVFAVAGAMTPFKRALHPRWKGAIPATFLFDDAQKLRHFWEGPILEREIAPILQGFLAGEPIDGETRPPLTGEN